MQTFARHKTLAEIKTACEVSGFPINTQKYDHAGSDFITVGFEFKGAVHEVTYNTCNGRFFGKLVLIDKLSCCGKLYTEMSTYLDNEDWYQALLDFLYVLLPDAQPAAACSEGCLQPEVVRESDDEAAAREAARREREVDGHEE